MAVGVGSPGLGGVFTPAFFPVREGGKEDRGKGSGEVEEEERTGGEDGERKEGWRRALPFQKPFH